MAENKIDPKFNIHSNYTKVNILNPYRFAVGNSYEPETLNYMAAVGIADDSTVYYAGTPQEITGNGFYLAIETFVKSLKTEGIFGKLKAVYPLIGGTADRHKWNLMNPQDTNDAHRILWYGSGTHSKTGFKGDGSTAYGNTNFFQDKHSKINNESFGFYSRTDSAENNYDMGIRASDYDSFIYSRYNNNTLYSVSQSNSYGLTPFVSDSLGFYSISRLSSSEFKIQKNTTFWVSEKTSDGGLSTSFFALAARGVSATSASGGYSNREYSFFYIGEGLNQTEMTAYYNAVQQLQTDLGRAV